MEFVSICFYYKISFFSWMCMTLNSTSIWAIVSSRNCGRDSFLSCQAWRYNWNVNHGRLVCSIIVWRDEKTAWQAESGSAVKLSLPLPLVYPSCSLAFLRCFRLTSSLPLVGEQTLNDPQVLPIYFNIMKEREVNIGPEWDREIFEELVGWRVCERHWCLHNDVCYIFFAIILLLLENFKFLSTYRSNI